MLNFDSGNTREDRFARGMEEALLGTPSPSSGHRRRSPLVVLLVLMFTLTVWLTGCGGPTGSAGGSGETGAAPSPAPGPAISTPGETEAPEASEVQFTRECISLYWDYAFEAEAYFRGEATNETVVIKLEALLVKCPDPTKHEYPAP